MLQLERVCVSIMGAEILRNVSLHVPPNSFVGLIGRNGAGKTTLMRAAMNLLPSRSGEIRMGDRATTQASASSHARCGVGYMPEDRRLIPAWTVEQNIRLPAEATEMPDAEARVAWCYDIIPEIRPFALRKAMELSGGQQKLVALARALMVSQRLLLLDEPFEGVAPALAQRIADILARLRTDGSLSVLISESDAVHSRGLVDRTYMIERGEVTEAHEQEVARGNV